MHLNPEGGVHGNSNQRGCCETTKACAGGICREVCVEGVDLLCGGGGGVPEWEEGVDLNEMLKGMIGGR